MELRVGPLSRLVYACMSLILKKSVCSETSDKDWPLILMYAQRKGYLYASSDKRTFVCAYRVPEWDEKWGFTMPESESGSLLYVAFAVSVSNDKLSLLRMLRSMNDVNEIIYYRRGNDRDLRRVRVKHGKR